jgi:acyl dehydratase
MSVDVSQIEIGDYLERVTKILDQDRMDRFEKVGRILITQGAETEEPTNIHTDPEKAKAMGLDRPIASGQMSYSYFHELMCRQFGIDFRQGGSLSVTFLKPVYAGDTVSVQGIVEGKDEADGRTIMTVNVWLENQDGEKTSTGQATVTIPSPRT